MNIIETCVRDAGLHPRAIETDLCNERSQKALERIGTVKERVLRHHMILPDGHYRHSVFYSILDTEWPKVRMRLEARIR